MEELEERSRALLARVDHRRVDRATFRGEQYDAGLAWVHLPVGKGGLDLPRDRQTSVDAVLRDAGVPYHDLLVNPIGIGMAAPTVAAYGSEDLQARHLRRIFTGEDTWCQLFSEPSAGSDVAGVATRAVRDGDEWVVNGQKVWTTLAHVSSYGLLLARTDPDVPKHAGLSYFVIDMHAPGVDVRPLFQITGDAEFNEVFLTDVRIPHAHMLGREGDGWRVATTTLMNERVALGGTTKRAGGPIQSLLAVWERRRHDFDPDRRQVLRDRIADLWIRSEVVRLTGQRAKASAGRRTGPEGSISKLLSAELNQHIFELCLEVDVAAGLLNEAGYPMSRADGATTSTLTQQFLRARANTIEGGTSEIMRNILAERLLNLPGEPRADKHLPWKDIAC